MRLRLPSEALLEKNPLAPLSEGITSILPELE